MSKLEGSDEYFILNMLSGNADIISPEEAEKLLSADLPSDPAYKEKGYLAEPEEEQHIYEKELARFRKDLQKEEVQIFFVPWYSCNFSCSYCFQAEYDKSGPSLDKEKIDAFFNYINDKFEGRTKYVTLFGGEPLLADEHSRELIDHFITKAGEKSIDIAVVSNGYNLAEYIDVLKKANIREIQITLDGIKEVHDVRRNHLNGKGSFDKIARGIDSALSAGFKLNLRVVADKDNINGLPDLARFAIDKGWTDNPGFKTQIGRNYDLHSCAVDKSIMFDRAEIFEELYRLSLEYPEILKFHRPAFSISRFLHDNGRLPAPSYDACPAAKTEWAFDYSGAIYPCTAYVGVKKESLGTYYPVSTEDHEAIKTWQARSIETIEECRECSYKLVCGGGCGAVAKNSEGKVISPDCNPVKRQLELGISLYFNKEEEHVRQNTVCNCS